MYCRTTYSNKAFHTMEVRVLFVALVTRCHPPYPLLFPNGGEFLYCTPPPTLL